MIATALTLRRLALLPGLLLGFLCFGAGQANSETEFDAVDEEEYRIYVDFLAAGAPAPAKAVPTDFADIWCARSISTVASRYAEASASVTTRLRSRVERSKVLLDAYRLKNLRPGLIPRTIQETGFRPVVTTDGGHKKSSSPAELLPPGSSSGLDCGTLRFSRIGIDPASHQALLQVFVLGGGPSVGYFVVMRKSQEKWKFSYAIRTHYLIH